MDKNKHFIVKMLQIAIVALVVIACLLLIFLWPYRILVALCVAALLLVIIAIALTYSVVGIRGELSEQDLRHTRVHPQQELPLNVCSRVPYYMPPGAQFYPQQQFYVHTPSSPMKAEEPGSFGVD